MFDKDKRELKLSRWGGECSLNVGYARLAAEAADRQEIRAHVKPGRVRAEDKEHVLDIILKRKPPRNTWTFPLRSKGLRFAYQPSLTEEEVKAGCIRPPEVVGSYAVYHKTKKHNQYETGKFCHIYRPEAVDAMGNRTWCILHIDKNRLTVTVPQEFLDEAAYPVTVDPDFGETGIGGSWGVIAETFGPPSEYRRGSAWTMPAPGGTANYIRAYLREQVAADTCDCKVFINQKDSVAAGQHGQIAGPVENLACAAAAHWEEFTLGGEVLTAAVVYILNIMGSFLSMIADREYQLAYDVNGAVDSYYEPQTYGAPESPWVRDPEGVTKDYSIYCNYTAGVPPPPLPTPARLMNPLINRGLFRRHPE